MYTLLSDLLYCQCGPVNSTCEDQPGDRGGIQVSMPCIAFALSPILNKVFSTGSSTAEAAHGQPPVKWPASSFMGASGTLCNMLTTEWQPPSSRGCCWLYDSITTVSHGIKVLQSQLHWSLMSRAACSSSYPEPCRLKMTWRSKMLERYRWPLCTASFLSSPSNPCSIKRLLIPSRISEKGLQLVLPAIGSGSSVCVLVLCFVA